MSRYETAIDLDNPNNSQTQLVQLIGPGQVVLDVGCAAGDTARALKQRSCSVSGVDIDADAASAARDVLDELVIADIERDPLSQHFKAESFDAIVFGDVLEHLNDPWAALHDATGLLKPGGRILVSIPNVSHGAVRLSLLSGRWVYTDKGLLDRTHLRFFTLDGVVDLLEGAGLTVEVLRSTVLDPLATEEIRIATDRFPPALVEWVRHQPGAMDYQYIAAARLLEPGEERRRRVPLEPIVAYDVARLRDQHTEAREEQSAAQHQVLTVRDHVIGLEARVTSAKRRTARAQLRAKKAERRFRRLRTSLAGVVDEVDAISRSKRPRTHLRRLANQLRADLNAAQLPADGDLDD